MPAPAFAKTKLLAHDVVGAIFAEAKRNHGITQFPFDDDGVQDLFFELASSGDYPILSRYFVFSGPTPESKKLTEAMARLQLAGSIGRLNPAYEVTTVADASVEYYDDVIASWLSDADAAQIAKLAAEFASRVKAKQQH